ncbi:MAG TPA: hypothetical protein V6D09_22185 [Leptolyngbyaceae cyanobacterium]
MQSIPGWQSSVFNPKTRAAIANLNGQILRIAVYPWQSSNSYDGKCMKY